MADQEHGLTVRERKVRAVALFALGGVYWLATDSTLGLGVAAVISCFFLLGALSNETFRGFVHGAIISLVISLFRESWGMAAFFAWFIAVMPTYDDFQWKRHFLDHKEATVSLLLPQLLSFAPSVILHRTSGQILLRSLSWPSLLQA